VPYIKKYPAASVAKNKLAATDAASPRVLSLAIAVDGSGPGLISAARAAL